MFLNLLCCLFSGLAGGWTIAEDTCSVSGRESMIIIIYY